MSTCASFMSVVQYLHITFQKCYSLRCVYPQIHTYTLRVVSKHDGQTGRGHLVQNILCTLCADSELLCSYMASNCG